jgi:SAM-dependent methyltransferase
MTNRVDFDKYTNEYNLLLQERTGFFSKDDAYFARYKVELMKSRLTQRVKTILEYGCGIGRNISFIREAFPYADVVGTDISQASLDIARQDHPEVSFITESDELSDIGKFDLIFVAGVYHHIPVAKRTDVSDLLYRRLDPFGNLFVFEHNPYNPITRRIVSKCPYDDDAVLLRPKELREHLRQSGFRNPHTEYCLFVPPNLTMLTWIEPRLCWLPLGGQYFVHVSK